MYVLSKQVGLHCVVTVYRYAEVHLVTLAELNFLDNLIQVDYKLDL